MEAPDLHGAAAACRRGDFVQPLEPGELLDLVVHVE